MADPILNKKLVVSGLDSVTDAVKDNIIKAAGVSNGAAKVVRDGNGKVVEVVIHLPESASEAAVAAIAATPGVANVEVTDIPEGTQGFDGTPESLAALEASGFVRADYQTPVLTFNEDSTMTYSPAGLWAVTYWTGYGKAPSYPLPAELEFKVKTPNYSQNILISMGNDMYGFNIQLQGNSPDHPGTNTLTLYELEIVEVFSYVPQDQDFHICKASVNETGLMKVYFDGVEKISRQLTARPGFRNYVDFAVASVSERPMIIDYARWTKRP